MHLHYLGMVTHEVGLHDLAARIWHTGLLASHQFVDVPLRLSFRDSLLEHHDVAERASLEAERTALLGECLYIPLLASRGLEVDPVAVRDPLFEQLRRRLESVALASASSAPTQHTAA